MSVPDRSLGFETRQLHAGFTPDSDYHAAAPPIYQTTSYVFPDFETARAINALEDLSYDYTRIGNPTVEFLENRLADLEGGTAAVAFASGQAATANTILNITHAGDNVVASRTVYGGSYNLFANTLPRHGVTGKLVDAEDPANVERAIDEHTRGVFIETIGNPDINVLDVERLAEIAHAAGIPLILDNTFATPYLFSPFEHGVDISIHSATKFIGGHGTTIGGLVVDGGTFDWSSGKFPDFTEPDPSYGGIVHWEKWGDFPDAGNVAFAFKLRLHYLRTLGAAMSPFSAFLLIQGLETLSLRLERQVANAKAVAEFLAEDPRVDWVSYPGLPSSPYYDLSRRYLPRGAGSVVGFGVKGGLAAARTFIEALQVFTFLANVGDSRSLALHPATVTHSQLSEEQQIAAGVRPEQIRLSVGTESVEDLLWDLDQALGRAV
ncbi:O-acetylhomoserine aminocarboxypropyltransferase/cysteine synthase family protein [Propionicicella superfundia]|uniref:O-acetylhomoserine aminocarboxypropyltransferase/cysteine synthase family protein n=1 Tax=Propionicicella superfundia TaxID=348582 RepID=UPI0004051A4F|nr:O-acetylhomoserine aminocarboxypropyltransferase/cysteine synthase family protein [Propionicicella superfundia]